MFTPDSKNGRGISHPHHSEMYLFQYEMHALETHAKSLTQEASSSVIPFISFLDDVTDILKARCLGYLHCLLHVDDTLVLSTNREHFRKKYNVRIETIKQKKCNCLIINHSKDDTDVT